MGQIAIFEQFSGLFGVGGDFVVYSPRETGKWQFGTWLRVLEGGLFRRGGGVRFSQTNHEKHKNQALKCL